ncbi:hypothetical protein SAMN05216474_0619 [Lishizhenia tianjinensis]|uniref:Uncharacterized protein n=1 Tax=Lishizhenia tianjinensis TaxID=477690 RepID=A0A1I6Y303_9FLAO|nr:hypothetical protein [Lishizhenia tianjinensis]SFT44732.1 hypothetical protein SAMN05216474_0619 [Lishizhenia tianjinensis]
MNPSIKYLVLLLLFSFVACNSEDPKVKSSKEKLPQPPLPNGEYMFKLFLAEHDTLVQGENVKVKIEGNQVVVSFTGKGKFNLKQGDIISAGTLRQNQAGIWMISNNPKDAEVNDIYGCNGAPNPIDFELRTIRLCPTTQN